MFHSGECQKCGILRLEGGCYELAGEKGTWWWDSGLSGMRAVAALCHAGAEPILFDENEKLTIEEVRGKLTPRFGGGDCDRCPAGRTENFGGACGFESRRVDGYGFCGGFSEKGA